MAIDKRESGTWRARYRGPDRRERSRTFQRRADAERWLRSQEQAVERGDWVDPARSGVQLSTWAEQWLLGRSDLRPTSRARLTSIVRLHVLAAFGDRKLSTISNSEVRAWVARMVCEQGMSPASARKALFALRAMLDAAVADRRLSANPAPRCRCPSSGRSSNGS